MSYQEIVLAAWLHDIGKFAQRAGVEGSGGHQNYTERFLQSVKDCLPNDEGINADEVIRLASRHHNPAEYDEWLIAHGDRISNGAEKCNIVLESKNRDDETPEKLYQTPLVHLVSSLHIKEKQKPTIAYSPLEPMEGKAIFPSNNTKTNKNDYQELWNKFERDFHALQGLKYIEFIRSLDTLMERYCWCIPSSTLPDDDISLYQHSKLAAAFAGTLFLYHEEKNTQTIPALEANDEQAFLFVQGDMSGIQKYIFDLKTTEYNAKLLRARSFQVWVLSDIIAVYLTEKFGVSRENIITSAGGKFLLLTPNTQTVLKNLPELRLDIESYFLQEFAGKITFILSDGVPASSKSIEQRNMQELLNNIGTCGDMAKQKKMQAVLREHGHVLEEHYNDLQKNGECTCCETLAACPNDEKMCKSCRDLIEKGGQLMKVNKIVLKTDKLAPFSMMVSLLRKDDQQFGYLTEYSAGYPLMFLPYTAPLKDNGSLCPFEEIADKAKGNKKLALFKADIDNLGLIFTSSWGEEKDNRISFSRYAQLSRHLHSFFSGFIAGFISDHSEYRKKIYTVFSGGDDLCILGAWDAIMDFAVDFRNKLSEFTNNNPSITLSGSIALVDSHLPVRTAADMAENALKHEAKERKDKDGRTIKNGISVFGVTVSWEEYEESLKDAEIIVQFMDDKQVSSAVVYKMIDFANRAQRFRNGNMRDKLWMSNYRYIVARNIKPEHKKAIEFFHKFSVSPDAMEKSRIAVSYALYANRKGKED